MTKEKRNEQIRELARKLHEEDGAVEIDDDAKISEIVEGEECEIVGPDPDNGAYVQAWVWVPFAGVEGLDREETQK